MAVNDAIGKGYCSKTDEKRKAAHRRPLPKQSIPLTGKCLRQTAAQGAKALAPIDMEKMSDYDSLLDSRHHKHAFFLMNVTKTCALCRNYASLASATQRAKNPARAGSFFLSVGLP